MLDVLIGKVANRERERLGDEMKLREMLAGMQARLEFMERLMWFVLLGTLSIVGLQIAKFIFT